MNRTDRLQAIITHLQSKKQVTANEIAERFGISIRTVYRDIKALNEAGIPIGSEAGIGYFLDDNYHLPPVMFTNDEAGSLLLAGKFLEQQGDMKLNKHFNDALYKIKSVLRSSGKDFLENIEKRISVFQPGIENLGTDNFFINHLQKALSEKQKVQLVYLSGYRQEETQRTVQPIGLIYYSLSWHLLAYCELRNDYRDFRLDRIKKLDILGSTYKIDQLHTIDHYFENLALPEDALEIILEFTADAFHLLGPRKYYLGYTGHEQQNETIVAHFINTDLEYVARWVLSFGNNVAIISPVKLKSVVVKMIETLNQHYQL